MLGRDRAAQGIDVEGDATARSRIELHVVVEHGLNLAEVAATVRSQVAYEVERLTGLTVAAVEVVIQDVQAERVRSRARRELARRARRDLEAHRRRIDDLNVYPVPDGDTGTNLTLTVRARSSRRSSSDAPTTARRSRRRSRAPR